MRIFSPSLLLSLCRTITSLPPGEGAFAPETGAQVKPIKALSTSCTADSDPSGFLHFAYQLQECSFTEHLQPRTPVSKLTPIFHLPPNDTCPNQRDAGLQLHLHSRLCHQKERVTHFQCLLHTVWLCPPFLLGCGTSWANISQRHLQLLSSLQKPALPREETRKGTWGTQVETTVSGPPME